MAGLILLLTLMIVTVSTVLTVSLSSVASGLAKSLAAQERYSTYDMRKHCKHIQSEFSYS